MTDTGSVLVVDDEFLIADLLTEMLEDMGLRVCGSAASADDAVALAKAHAPMLVLMDVRLKGAKDGLDAAAEIRAFHPVPVIFITGSREPETVHRIEADHAAAVAIQADPLCPLEQAVRDAIG